MKETVVAYREQKGGGKDTHVEVEIENMGPPLSNNVVQATL